MATTGILDRIFGGASTEVQIPSVPAPKKTDPSPFDIDKAKAGQGKFPPQPDLFVNTARTSGHLSNIALAKLIDAAGYTLQDVQDLWNSGDITDQSTYIVITHGLLPPRESLRYVYSAELLCSQLPGVPKGSQDGSESVRYVEQGQSFVVNAPQGFHVYVFCSDFTLVEGHTLPDELSSGAATITLQVQRHTVGSIKSDNSTDHTFTFTQRVAALTKDLAPIPSGTLRFIARAELIRI
jgi:hypothetical protein